MRPARLLFLLIPGLLCGCQTIPLPKSLAWTERQAEESPSAVPVRMVSVWTDAMYTEPGKPAVRGFSGRLYFYDQDKKAVPVDGQLVVYGYDDSAAATRADRPQRKFVFPAEKFGQHFTPGQLGASYSIWLPWDPLGGVQKKVSLLPVFTATSGAVVVGEQTVHVLAGKAPPAAAAPPEGPAQPVQPAGYQQPISSGTGVTNAGELTSPPDTTTEARRLRTTTIKLPMTMTQRLIQNGTSPLPGAATRGNELGPSNNSSLNPLPAPGAAQPANLPGAASDTGTPQHVVAERAGGVAGTLQAVPGSIWVPATEPSPTTSAGSGERATPRSARFERPRYRVPTRASAR